jgi:CubicO group peptidase (beta-lactamase class C family)
LKENGSFAASGIFGQGIHINPAEELVIAVHSARKVASEDTDWALEDALFEALTEALRHR